MRFNQMVKQLDRWTETRDEDWNEVSMALMTQGLILAYNNGGFAAAGELMLAAAAAVGHGINERGQEHVAEGS